MTQGVYLVLYFGPGHLFWVASNASTALAVYWEIFDRRVDDLLAYGNLFAFNVKISMRNELKLYAPRFSTTLCAILKSKFLKKCTVEFRKSYVTRTVQGQSFDPVNRWKWLKSRQLVVCRGRYSSQLCICVHGRHSNVTPHSGKKSLIDHNTTRLVYFN